MTICTKCGMEYRTHTGASHDPFECRDALAAKLASMTERAEAAFRAIRNTHGIAEAHQRANAGLRALGIDPSKEQGK